MPKGDCFQAALNFVSRLDRDEWPEYRVCHGEPVGQGPIEGVRHAHAWVERTQTMRFPAYPDHDYEMVVCIDVSNDKEVAMPAQLYYKIGQIDEAVRYRVDEARRLAVEQGHYGPWVEWVEPS